MLQDATALVPYQADHWLYSRPDHYDIDAHRKRDPVQQWSIEIQEAMAKHHNLRSIKELLPCEPELFEACPPLKHSWWRALRLTSLSSSLWYGDMKELEKETILKLSGLTVPDKGHPTVLARAKLSSALSLVLDSPRVRETPFQLLLKGMAARAHSVTANLTDEGHLFQMMASLAAIFVADLILSFPTLELDTLAVLELDWRMVDRLREQCEKRTGRKIFG